MSSVHSAKVVGTSPFQELAIPSDEQSIIISLTVPMQLTTPPQSPVVHALPVPPLGPVPALLKLQFVRPQTRPCHASPTLNVLVLPVVSSKPPVPGPLPDCVRIPGYIGFAHLLVIISGVPDLWRFSR